MQVNKYPWHRLRLLPFLERRYVEATYSTAPGVAYMGWTEYRLCIPFRQF